MKKLLKWLVILVVVLIAGYYAWFAWAVHKYGQHLQWLGCQQGG